MKTVLVTGSSGLIGSEIVSYFCERGWKSVGVDNNMRAEFFGEQASTMPRCRELKETYRDFHSYHLDIRDRLGVIDLMVKHRPDLIVHAAAQPSHDWAASNPALDFSVNAVGTHTVLEAARKAAPEAVFVFMSTNKVYGDNPNKVALKELPTRYDYDQGGGIPETVSVDHCTHSLFGASKLSADILVQEYGRYFGMKTCCLRGGCLTGPNHASVELHGFLNYLMRAAIHGKTYRIFGYKGKQVRDNIHAFDVATFVDAFFQSPRSGEVYNLGGGRNNSISVIEAIELAGRITGKRLTYEYVDEPRVGDHICYISDLLKIQSHYPAWAVTRSLNQIFEEIFVYNHA